MKKLMPVLAILTLIALVFYGCTEERDTLPWDDDGGGDVDVDCLACHGDEDLLKQLLPPDEGKAVGNRGDG
jgi:hypothetical protein